MFSCKVTVLNTTKFYNTKQQFPQNFTHIHTQTTRYTKSSSALVISSQKREHFQADFLDTFYCNK